MQALNPAPLILMCLVLCGCASTRSTTQTEQYIIDSERQWAESTATGETAALERILADDFIGVDPEGNLYDKPKMISDTREEAKYFTSSRLNHVKVRFFGNTAVAQGDESWVRRTGQPLQGRYVWTDTWVRRNGRWQIVAAEDLVPPEKAP